MAVKIALAQSPDDREAIFRLRYDIYIDEMHRSQKHADHPNRRIEEPLDANARLFIARDDAGRPVGTVRMNFGSECNFGYYENLYRMKSFESFYPSRISITTKLMVDREYRQSLLPMQLACTGFKLALQKGAAFDIIDCNFPLKQFFERLGYRQVFPDIHHPEYGHVIPMVLCYLDYEWLTKMRSPFRRHVRGWPDESDSLGFFYKTLYAEAGKITNGNAGAPTPEIPLSMMREDDGVNIFQRRAWPDLL